jgi:alkaline phosphatase
MNKIKLVFPTLLLCLFSLSCNRSVQQLTSQQPKAKNIILLIGDGMGLAQVSSAYYFSDGKPNFSRFKCIGLHQNTPIGELITDSASGATAFSIGYKSYNAAIGVDKDTVARETILEWASKHGKSTGLAVTCSITHATPGSFYAHVAHREMHEDIAADFVRSPVDFAAGGGYQFFAKRKDGRNLLDSLSAKGIAVDTTRLGTSQVPGHRYAYLVAPDSLHSIWGGRGDFLPKATQTALDFLSKDKDGFFLMVEGSQIDWGGHNNNAQYLINEVKDFDQVIGLALDFAEKDGNTLVVVTADHETGGFALSAPVIFGRGDYHHISPTFSTPGHTASLIPVFAYGPGAEQFMGIYQNNDIFWKMMAIFKGEGTAH